MGTYEHISYTQYVWKVPGLFFLWDKSSYLTTNVRNSFCKTFASYINIDWILGKWGRVLIYVFKCAIQVLRWSNECESSFVSNLAKLQRKFNDMMKTVFEEDVSSCTVTFDLNVLRKAGSLTGDARSGQPSTARNELWKLCVFLY